MRFTRSQTQKIWKCSFITTNKTLKANFKCKYELFKGFCIITTNKLFPIKLLQNFSAEKEKIENSSQIFYSVLWARFTSPSKISPSKNLT